MSYLRLGKQIEPGPALSGFSGGRSAEDPIFDGGFGSVLKVLAGPSPWQSFIQTNLKILKNHLPNPSFRILSLREFTDLLSKFGRKNERNIPGFTEKQTGAITMQEWGPNTKSTFLGAALHEAVHLVSHPPQQGKVHSTAREALGDGLLEGLVECVTIDILQAQKIGLAPSEKRGHLKRLKVAVALLLPLGIPLLGRVLFEGDYHPFVKLMHHTFSVPGWEEIKRLTTADQPDLAIKLAGQLRAKEEQRRRLNKISQQIRHPLAPALGLRAIEWK